MNPGLTIFYIDDDQDDREFFTEIVDLIDENIEVITLRNGPELIQALKNPPVDPDCLFLDVNMPGMNGFETLRIVRSIEKFRHIPIVMFSTSGDKETIEKSKELGASLFVQKSGILENLRGSIKHVLDINWRTFQPDNNNFVYSN